jgi:flavin reductase (DIM6/NTAB) family NADH-FMN oxidoreductase RutF
MVSAAEFKRAVGQFASGVTVVTTRDGDQPLGLTVSSFCSVSLEPPLVLVSIDRRAEALAGFRASGLFGVSVLAEGQEDVSRRFARAGPAKFEGLVTEMGHLGVVLIPGALAQLECRVTAAHEAGDHVLFVGRVERLGVRPGRPLLYHASAYHRLPGGPQDDD